MRYALSFFMTVLIDMPWGYDPKDEQGTRVFYFDGDLNKLERKSTPKDMEIFDASTLCFSSVLELPSIDNDLVEVDKFSKKEEVDKFYDLRYNLNEEFSNKILGHSDNIQGGIKLECELTKKRIYCKDQSQCDDPRYLELRENITDRALLLQIDSNKENGMMWGNFGKIYFWITK